MTARPQDVALVVPLPEWTKRDDAGQNMVPSELRVAMADYARANVTAALASAQAREDELRAEVEMLRASARSAGEAMGVEAEARADAEWKVVQLAEEVLKSRERAERLEESLRWYASGRNYYSSPGDRNPVLKDCGARARAALSPTTAAQPSFQARVVPWLVECFGEDVTHSLQERGDRFLEEALELLQSTGYDKQRVSALVDYVYNRPPGETPQEVGGVMVTLAALCYVAQVDMHDAGETELARIQLPEVTEKIRKKQQSKRDIHSPLPGFSTKLDTNWTEAVPRYYPKKDT